MIDFFIIPPSLAILLYAFLERKFQYKHFLTFFLETRNEFCHS
jgi:hypothetical protein